MVMVVKENCRIMMIGLEGIFEDVDAGDDVLEGVDNVDTGVGVRRNFYVWGK